MMTGDRIKAAMVHVEYTTLVAWRADVGGAMV